MRHQNLDLQIDALKTAGVLERDIFVEKASGGSKELCPQLDLCLRVLRPGDTLVIWKLDRLALAV